MAVPVLVVGLGPIGQRVCSRVLARYSSLHLEGAVDSDATKAGRPLSQLVPDARDQDLVITATVPAAPRGGGVAVQATGSTLDHTALDVLNLLARGWNVLSTCEELAHAMSVDRTGADRLHAAACAARLTVLSAGINPGFVMDVLPLTLSTVCTRVDSVQVVRVVNTDERRLQLQQKAGVGLEEGEFRRRAAAGLLGHVGLRQSAFLLADGLGWTLSKVDVSLEPVIATTRMPTELGMVPSGGVIGQHEVAVGSVLHREVIRLDLTMAAGMSSLDSITIDGDPPLQQHIEGGVNGDVGTEAVVANLIPAVFAAPAGLTTVVDLLSFRCTASR